MRIGAQKTKARTTNHRSTEYVQGRQRKQSQQNCTPSCKKVGLTLTQISSFQKRQQKKRKKHANLEDVNSLHGSLQSEIFKVHSDDLSKIERCRGSEKQKTDTSQTLKMMTA